MKKVLIILLVLLLTAGAGFGGWLWYDNNVDRSGWEEKEGIQYYRDFHGRRVTGWQDIQDNRYYFDE